MRSTVVRDHVCALFFVEGSANISAITTAIGKGIGLMHDCDVVHGDLTTSNIMVRRINESDQYNSVVFVDFGLGAMKATPEDKAVDLYVLERAFISTHPNSESLVRTSPDDSLQRQISLCLSSRSSPF